MTQYILTPRVDQAREFMEIAKDFANPLDVVREAISNAYDANATKIEIYCSTRQDYGEDIFELRIIDNGHGMSRDELQAFFDLGNSTSRRDPSLIGKKGHGTKVYFNSDTVRVQTTKSGTTLEAEMAHPKAIFREELPTLPTVTVTESKHSQNPTGTTITIIGYPKSQKGKFNHARLKDHVLWFTKHGSVEHIFGDDRHKKTVLLLQGLDRQRPEKIPFGHPFPRESEGDIEKLEQKYKWRAPDYYCKRVVTGGSLPNFPEIHYDLVFSLEGNRVKYENNDMISRQHYQAPGEGAYRVQERYGLWLCKDFIPIQRHNEWVVDRGSEFTRFQAFFNCQKFSLTANRGSVENTPAEIMQDVAKVVREEYERVKRTDDWDTWDELEKSAEAIRDVEKEVRDLKKRQKRANSANIAPYKNHTLVEPTLENGVFALVVQLELLEPAIFPFKIVDYDAYSGIDALVKGDRVTPVEKSELYYVEFKHTLIPDFNHSFKNTHSIVCWDTEVKQGGVINDISGEERRLSISPPNKRRNYTRYCLSKRGSAHSIEVYVLKDYLKERLRIDFRPRTKTDTV